MQEKVLAVCVRARMQECKKRGGQERREPEEEEKAPKTSACPSIHPAIPSIRREILSLSSFFPIPIHNHNHLTYLALNPANASGLCLPLPAKPWKSLLSWLTCLVPLVGMFPCGTCCGWLKGFMLPLKGIVALRCGACICCCCWGTLSSGRDWSGRWGAS